MCGQTMLHDKCLVYLRLNKNSVYFSSFTHASLEFEIKLSIDYINPDIIYLYGSMELKSIWMKWKIVDERYSSDMLHCYL